MTSVTYSSTRGQQNHISFRDAVMIGLANDKGLFIPDSIPQVSWEELHIWRTQYKDDFAGLAIAILSKYIQDDQVPYQQLQSIIRRSCASFRHDDVTPIVTVGGHSILELFHGPTFAFKDVALQMLGNFFEYFLQTGSNDGRLAVLGATSGDTGSAAIAGLRNKKGIDCIILFPNGRVSNIQERQMTTITDDNIHCVAIDGTFDDCQDLVKASFNTTQFRDDVHLGAVNSINWCRVLAQTTYYFWSYIQVTNQDPNIKEVHYSVPTGNFGDVLAGYYAKQMGLPIGKLVVATNENDILHRFFTKGTYHRYDIAETLSPSMDICVSSNFERYLYHLANNDAQLLTQWMDEFEKTGKLTITDAYLRKAQSDFDSARVDTKGTIQVIQEYASKYNYMLCPHSAVGVAAIHQLHLVQPGTVCLATAHDGKFPDAVQRAIGTIPKPPPELDVLYSLPTRRTELPNDLQAVQAFVKDCIARNPCNKKSSWWMNITEPKNLLTVSAIVGITAITISLLNGRRR